MEASSLQARLSLEELALFDAGAEGSNRYEAWRAGQGAANAALVRSNSLKRKWSEDQKENAPINAP